jgi:S-adenosylmethionine-diacylglycerol 3-amino-3-carboxypropyl transferase
MSLQIKAIDRLNDHVFNSIYSRSLVYNTCWEDPAIDRQVLKLGPDDHVMVITSAGCNVLDYVLTGPAHVYAVDMNPRQNALLELKIAGIRGLEFEDYFRIFGTGRHPDFELLYRQQLREHLGEFAQQYWDTKSGWFTGSSNTGGLYFRGLSGYVARIFHWYLRAAPGLRSGVAALLESASLDEQREIFDSKVQRHLWNNRMNWVLSSQLTMNMLGVPHPQRKEVEHQHADGVAGFIRESIEYVFRQIPLTDNYFWRVYMQGSYTRACCPEYLKEANFYRLKSGLADRISVHTDSVTGFLQNSGQQISRYVLLDHMDWMSSYRPDALVEEWQAIFNSASQEARVICRSAHQWPSYLQNLIIPDGQQRYRLVERLRFYPELAASLQAKDRVHTYAGFHIADVIA